MTKIILVLCVVFTFAKAFSDSDTNVCLPKKLIVYSDKFLELKALQHLKIIQDYNSRLEQFREHYFGSLAEVDIQNELLVHSMTMQKAQFITSESLNDSVKYCISKYSVKIPNEIYTTISAKHCGIEAHNKVTSLFSRLNSTRNSLLQYYKKNFQEHIKNCGESYKKATANYSLCINAAASNLNTYTFSNEKDFNNQLEEAKCTSRTYIRRAVDCNYTVQIRAISLMAEAELLIDNCLNGKDKDNEPCNEEYDCPDSYNLHVDYEQETISNPFNLHKNHTGCLVFNVISS